MKRLAGWLIRKLGLRNLLVLGLLLMTLGSVVLGLADVIRGLDAVLLWTIAVTGVFVEWALAATSMGGWKAGGVSAALGFGVVLVRVGHLGGKLLSILGKLVRLYWATVRFLLLAVLRILPIQSWTPKILVTPASDWMSLITDLSSLWRDLHTLLIRVWRWLTMLTTAESLFDPVAVAVVWSWALWAVSAWAVWWVRRRERPLPAVVPAGVLLMTTLAYVRAEPTTSLMFLGAFLLLLALVGYDSCIQRWQAMRIDFPDLNFEVGVAAIVLSLTLVTASLLAPSFSVRKIIDFVEGLGQQRAERARAITDSLGMEQQPTHLQSDGRDSAHDSELPRSHLINTRPKLSNDVVMVISTGDLPAEPPEVALSRGQPPPRYYWRSLTYDVYNGRGWRASRTEMRAYEAGRRIITPTLPTQRLVRQEVKIAGDVDGLLYIAGTLAAADHDYQVAWRSHQDLFGAMVNAQTYRADSLVPVVSEETLRTAGIDYPEWIRKRYLRLPETVPPRVLALARDLTATASTPYDRAQAIEAYLRDFPYTLDVPSPPRDRDVVDYFLFELQEGYCEYYATAMVVLARAAGLPARWVLGYAPGHYDWSTARYIVTEDNAHVWPEIYFPGYGWIEFEPTSGYDPIDRPSETASVDWPQPGEALEPVSSWWNVSGWHWWVGGLGVVGVVVALLLAWLGVEEWWLRCLKPSTAIGVLYQRLRRRGQRLPVTMYQGDTPYEFMRSLVTHASDLIETKRWGRIVESMVRDVQHLCYLYVGSNYSPHVPDRADRSEAVRIWRRLRWQLWLLRFFRRRNSLKTDRGKD